MKKNAEEITDFEEADDSFDTVVRKEKQCKMLRAYCNTQFVNRKSNYTSRYSLRTPYFSCKNNKNVKWMLLLGENIGPASNYISLSLKLLQCSDFPELEVFFKCSLKKDSVKVHTADTIFSLNLVKGNIMRISRFVPKSTLATRKLSHLKLSCKVYALPRLCLYSRNELSSALGALLREGTLADVTLMASGKALRAHKAVLSARSPVFARMFQNDMREARESRVCIEDVEPEVLAAFLRFAYTDQLEAHYESMAAALIVVADKYQFEGLRKAAVNLLLRKMNVGNAIDTLQLVESYQYDDIKKQVIEFINKHAKQIVKTSAFKKLTGTQAHLIAEIYSVMAMTANNGSDQSNPINPRSWA